LSPSHRHQGSEGYSKVWESYMEGRTETYFIDRVKAGDREAFTWLVDQYKDMVYTICLRMLVMEADAMEALPETDAVIVTLFYYDGMSLDEIAAVIGISNGNVRVRLHRSRKKMYQVITNNLRSEVSSLL